jgi:hypothetical protein
MSQNKDIFGFYRVGDLKFYSKLEAIEMHAKTGIHPHWDFNDAVFSSYDWTVEPKEDILELYRRRAQQLREKYDYIILAYSGGADSTTVLEAFVDNDIKLDEVVSYVNHDRDSFLSAEIYRVAIPNYEELKTRHPGIKFRLLDLTKFEMDFFNSNDNKFNWIYEMNAYINPNNASRIGFGMKVKEWADMIHAGKKVCILSAMDKPRVFQINGKYTFKFIDFIDCAATVSSMAGQQPWTDELFYWTPDMPEIMIKQGHIIKRYLEGDVNNLPFVSTVKSDLAYREVNGKKYWLSNHGMHRLIYPSWNIDTFSVGKAPSVIFSKRDEWFFNLQQEHEVRKNWALGIDKLWKTLPDYWKNDLTSISAGIKACWSKEYILDPK